MLDLMFVPKKLRWWSALAGCIAVAAILLAVARDQSKAATPSAEAVYPALAGAAPSGITVVTTAAQAETAEGPVWLERPTLENGGVDINSARELSLGGSQLRVWIAKSDGGGICVLAMRNVPNRTGPVGPASVCGAPTELLAGATMTLYGAGGTDSPTWLVGVVPGGVQSVAVGTANGVTSSVRVRENAYAIPVTAAVATVSFDAQGTLRTVPLGTR